MARDSGKASGDGVHSLRSDVVGRPSSVLERGNQACAGLVRKGVVGSAPEQAQRHTHFFEAKPAPLGGPLGSEAERGLVRALRVGDSAVFAALVDHYSPAMLRVARTFVPSREVAEEVVQETWMAVLRGLEGFEERSRLQTWLFRILINRARSQGARERRSTPFSALGETAEPTLDPDRFLSADPRYSAGPWTQPPRGRSESPERRALSADALRCVGAALDALPQRQRIAVTLRDLIGASAAEVAAELGISAVNERILLHRARSRIRRAWEKYHEGT